MMMEGIGDGGNCLLSTEYFIEACGVVFNAKTRGRADAWSSRIRKQAALLKTIFIFTQLVDY
jgi:hypothetical protein